MNTEVVGVSFDSSLPRLIEAVLNVKPDADFEELRAIRDMHGRLYLAVPDGWNDQILHDLRKKIKDSLGPYCATGTGVVFRIGDSLTGRGLYEEPSLAVWAEERYIHLIERRAVGQDWAIRPPNQSASDHPPRIVFQSLKGGVGRTTALILFGRELVRAGKTAMLLDLDLEAPGLGPQILPPEMQPRYGIVDWLAEDLVKNTSDEIFFEMVEESPIVDAPGLLVVPALGKHAAQNPGNVLGKLARAYLEGEDGRGFAERLRHMLDGLEKCHKSNVVLIDGRAGLHETVAANLLHLDSDVLFFAGDSPATWQSYRFLFSYLRQLAPNATGSCSEDWRSRFHMVYSKFDGTEAAERRYASSAYGVWADTLYDEVLPSENVDSSDIFSFDEFDRQAPHFPISILRSDTFEAFNPLERLASIGERSIKETFGDFFDAITEQVFVNTGGEE